MSIPRAKITKRLPGWRRSWVMICLDPECAFDRVLRSSMTREGAYSAERWMDHLRIAHGVRTVGSLTADDIGKWIEFPLGMDGRIAEVSHYSQEITSIHLDVKVGEFWRHPSTVCRVTEERP